MYDNETRSQTFVGVAIKQTMGRNKKEKYSFHTTGNRDGQQLGVWIPLPGTTKHFFTKLPKKMTRLEAAKWLLKECREQPFTSDTKIREFLKHQITKMEIRDFLRGESGTVELPRPVGRPRQNRAA